MNVNKKFLYEKRNYLRHQSPNLSKYQNKEFNYGPGLVFKKSLAKVDKCPDGGTLLVNFIVIYMEFWYKELLFFFTVTRSLDKISL